VADAAVFGLPDEEFGERIHAAVELTAPAAPADEAALREALRKHCRQHLANLKCPKSWSFHQPLPRLPTGKLAKKALRSAVLAAQEPHPAPAPNA
jgi:fatty-acyl-CoA synthase